MANIINGSSGNAFAVYSSVARTVTPDTQEFTLPLGAQSLFVVIDCTATAVTPSVVFKVEGVDRVSGKVWTLLQSAAVTATGTTILRISPSLTASANLIAKEHVPTHVRFTATHADADSITYTVAGILA